MIKKRDLIVAYNHFVFKGFAGCSALQRDLSYKLFKADLICKELTKLGIIEEFQSNRKRNVLIKDKNEAYERIDKYN